MARYSVTGNAATGTNVCVMQYMCAASPPNRLELHYAVIGSSATPADAVAVWEFTIENTEGTGGTTPTPEPLDQAVTSNPNFTARMGGTTPTGQGVVLTAPVHQRSTFSWVAVPKGEIITPQTDNNGVGFVTDVSAAAFDAHVCCHVEE